MKKRMRLLEGQSAQHESKHIECAIKHENHEAHNRRHDDAMNGLTEALKELTIEIRGIKKKEEIDDITINRTKNNYTTWDTIKAGAQGFSAIIGAGVLLTGTAYSVFKIMQTLSGD